MAEYERSRRLEASPDDVFTFISDVSNLPVFVPTVTGVEPEAGDHVRIHGKIGGRSFVDDGWVHVDQARHRLEWGATEQPYSGWMTVSGADGGSQVVAHLSVPPHVTPSGAPIEGQLEEGADPIAESLEAALESLRNVMEGLGGKEEPAFVG
jgi:hypothetical protein